MKSHPSKLLRSFGIAAMAFGLLGIGSCSESLEQICEQKLPALEHSLATALPAIGSETDLNWEIWAEQKLEEIQYWIDVLEYQENYKFVL